MPDLPVSCDHVDLLTTAAVRWRVVVSEPATTLTAGSGLFEFTADQTTALLMGVRQLATGAPLPDPCRFRPVAWPVNPVQVLKAVHAFEHMCEHLTAWDRSVARKLLAALAKAAIERIPGYSEAAWNWSRSVSLQGAPIGVAGDWRPPVRGLVWHGLDVDPTLWANARLVVVTAEALPTLPALPQRAGIYVLGKCPDDQLPDLWSANVAASQLLWWPICAPWLADQLSGGSGL